MAGEDNAGGARLLIEDALRLPPSERLDRAVGWARTRERIRAASAGALWAGQSSTANFDPLVVCEALTRHGVRYVIVGEVAGEWHGIRMQTQQIELAYERSDENVARLTRALDELGVATDVQALATRALLRLSTDAGVIALTSVGFDDYARDAITADLGAGLRAPIASLGDVLRTSLHRRDRDEEMLAMLEELADILREQGGQDT